MVHCLSARARVKRERVGVFAEPSRGAAAFLFVFFVAKNADRIFS
jgi:hypothetical protein